MKKNILLLLAVPYYIFSQTVDPYDYFPSSVGNRWEYSVQGGRILVHEIYKDSIDADGNKFIYYKRFYTDGEIFFDTTPNYKIEPSFNVFIYPTYQHLNYLWYKLDADSGDTWWVQRPDSTTPGEKAFLTKVYDGLVLGKVITIKRIEYYMMTPGDTNSTGFYLTTREIALGVGKIFEDKDAVQPDFLIGAIIDGDTLGTITSVDLEITNNLPSSITLYQNYPNPFNPTTNISYYLPNPGQIKISVYDILGREVAKLYEDWQQAGYHEIKFNTKNLSSPISSGIYFYTITAANQSLSKKMILLH